MEQHTPEQKQQVPDTLPSPMVQTSISKVMHSSQIAREHLAACRNILHQVTDCLEQDDSSNNEQQQHSPSANATSTTKTQRRSGIPDDDEAQSSRMNLSETSSVTSSSSNNDGSSETWESGSERNEYAATPDDIIAQGVRYHRAGYDEIQISEALFWELYELELDQNQKNLDQARDFACTDDQGATQQVNLVDTRQNFTGDSTTTANGNQNQNTAKISTAAATATRGTPAGEVNYDFFNLKIIHEHNKTGFEVSKHFKAYPGLLIAGQYQVCEFVGEAAFSTALKCIDIVKGGEVCVKVIKNNKDFLDQSLDEIKILKYLNHSGDPDKYNVLRLYDHFYFKEHLFIVSELLHENLYELSKSIREFGDEPYFTLPNLGKITKQILVALQFVHNLNLIHCDLKPENILIKDQEKVEVKVIDFGSSCFTTDYLSLYMQSRSYRAPEVILGAPYSQSIDLWSLGCILAELYTGRVLFPNESVQSLLARIVALCGSIPPYLMRDGRNVPKLFTSGHILYEKSTKLRREDDEEYYLLYEPSQLELKREVPVFDEPDGELFLDFITKLLQIDPKLRYSASEALVHPWILDVE